MTSPCEHLQVQLVRRTVVHDASGEHREYRAKCLCGGEFAIEPADYPQLCSRTPINAVLDKAGRPGLADAIATLDVLAGWAAKHAIGYNTFAADIRATVERILSDRSSHAAAHVATALGFARASPEDATEALLDYWKEYQRKRDEGR